MLERFLLIILITTFHGFATASDRARPNILFIFADDWGRYASAYAGIDGRPNINDIIKTPHIDKIAQRGVIFRNAFVNAPSCTPCRSALLSGRHFYATGRAAILQGAVWDGSVEAFPERLRNTGYHIGETWKVWSPGTPNDAPFGAGQHAFEKAGNKANNYSENVMRLMESGVSLNAARETLLAEVRGNFEAFLQANSEGRSWMYWFGPTTTHRTWVKGSGKALWGIQPDSLRGLLPKFLPDVPEIREDIADYLGEVQALDAYVGVIMALLEQRGLLEKTILVLSGDHGMPGMPGGKCNLYDFGTQVPLIAAGPGIVGGRVVDDFTSLMDLAPTFLEIAGAEPPAGMHGRSLLPIWRSDKVGTVDPTRDAVITGRERHVGSARAGNVPYPQRAIRTRDFLYVRNFAPDRWPMGDPLEITPDSAPDVKRLENDTRAGFADMDAGPTKAWLIARRSDPQWKTAFDYAFGKRPAEELYDLRNDPDQVTNVASDPAFQASKEALSSRLLKELEKTSDPRVIGDGQEFERAPFTDAEPARKRPAIR